MQENDRRIRRTRRALTAALVELVAKQPYESITIRDITDQADVGYATFFRHYASKDDVMLDIFQNVERELEAMTAAHGHGTDFYEKEGVLLFKHVQQNEVLYRSILDSLVFVRKLRKFFIDHTQKNIALHLEPLPDLAIPLEIAVHHMTTSLVSLIEWWLAHNMSIPVEQMAEIYDRLIIRATWQAIQAQNPLALPAENVSDK